MNDEPIVFVWEDDERPNDAPNDARKKSDADYQGKPHDEDANDEAHNKGNE